ncbi:decorin isoform X2 [Cephus cinctus]|uniref:Decorin isoform X2 n=1 Tax=Cephus cinctus TaxID=211228 RepID=A0AAJ7FVA3_CEPCN|nr:decorin isoform X2 [Cephus cinctus]
MNLLLLYGFLLVGVGMASIEDVMVLGAGSMLVMDQEIPLKRCRYNRVYSMLQAQCSNLGLDEIPGNLQTDIQVLDFSLNRVRELTNESLSRYSSLAYLYLGDNFIQTIEKGVFSNLRYLQVLDLTKNGLRNFPQSMFELPYLRKLYLAKNNLPDEAFQAEIKSPIEFLQLSKNKLSRIPRIGPQPFLTNLNLSENEIQIVSVDDIAGFCSLKLLDLTKNRIIFDTPDCGCSEFKLWTETRGIQVKPSYNCSQISDKCLAMSFSNRTLELRENCLDIIKIQEETKKARSTWILIASCIGAFIFCVVIALCCVHRRNKKRRQKLKEEQRLAANNANTELLNSNLQPEHT